MNLRFSSLLILFLTLAASSIIAAPTKTLPGHVPRVVASLPAAGRLPATNELHLAIGLPPRDQAGLDGFAAQVSDPASPNYRKYLTPEEFTARFGPTEADYEAAKNFAVANGFKIARTHPNRMLLDVTAQAGDVERAFHFRLQKYKHPTETREFFAPDSEPTVDAALPVADIQGLSDYARPRPRLKRNSAHAVGHGGTSPDGNGNYFGDDFRRAYVPGTTLTGAGQQVGLLQFDGFYAADVASYATRAGGGRVNIVIQTISADGYKGVPTTGTDSGESEVALDIEMAMSMAPGLAKIVVIEADPTNGNPNTILAAMVTNTAVRQFSCSWGWQGGPSTTTDNYFKELITQGQSFFNASGDSCAFTLGANSVNGVDNPHLPNAPSSSPYITQVGATTLITFSTGAFYFESVWNWGTSWDYDGTGSSGGVSSYYAIPDWQTNISMTVNQGSTVQRNIPDVTCVGDYVFVISGGHSPPAGTSGNGGTSCAAPLWAGFMALVNEQAASLDNASAGFINPAIYAIGKGKNPDYTYAACFNDVTQGRNTWSSSPSQYWAVIGYDLCSGWGSPRGMALVNALSRQTDYLAVSPKAGFSFNGAAGGPFAPASATLELTNSDSASLSWSLINTPAWLTVSSSSGVLAGNTSLNLTVSPNAAANALTFGSYSATLMVSNQTSQFVRFIPVTLNALQPLSVSPADGFSWGSLPGGPIVPGSQVFMLTNIGTSTVNWSLINTAAWLTATSPGGTLPAGGQTGVTVSASSAASALPIGTYAASLIFSNLSGAAVLISASLTVVPPICVQNGGFESGDFTNWTHTGYLADTSVTNSYTYVHSGSYGAKIGPAGAPGIFSQTLPTVPGQTYLVSFWVNNPQAGSKELFKATWDGSTIYSLEDPPAFDWTNAVFYVTATAPSTILRFDIRNDPAYFGLDDVSVSASAPVQIAPVQIASVMQTGSGFQLSINSTTGVTYWVQYTTNLLQPSWVDLGSALTGTGSTLLVTDTDIVDVPQRFYRVQAAPAP